MLSWSPALVAWIIGYTIFFGSTLRNRMPNSVPKCTRTPEENAVIHSPIGTKWKKIEAATKNPKMRTSTTGPPMSPIPRSLRRRPGTELRSRPDDDTHAFGAHHDDRRPGLHPVAFGRDVDALAADLRD